MFLLCLHMMGETGELLYKNTNSVHEGFIFITKALLEVSHPNTITLEIRVSSHVFWKGIDFQIIARWNVWFLFLFTFHLLSSKTGEKLRTLEKYYINPHCSNAR